MSPAPRHVRLDPAGLYWGVLNLPRRTRAEAACAAFEDVLPVNIEEVHAVFRRLDAARVLACGLPRDRARELESSRTPIATPAGVPEWLGVTVPAESIMLLIGEFTPRSARRWRAGVAAALTLAAVVVCVCVAIGAERRRAASEAVAVTAGVEVRALLVRCAPGADSGLPPALRLAAAVRQARAEAERAAKSWRVPDAGSMLAALLRAWPRDLAARVQLIQVGATGITVSVWVREPRHADHLAESLRAADRLVAEPPRISSERDGVLVRLHLRPSEGAS